MASQWIVQSGETEYGPFSSKQLQQLVQERKVGRKTLVRRTSDEQWTSAGDLKGLIPQAEKPPVANASYVHQCPACRAELHYATPIPASAVACDQCGHNNPQWLNMSWWDKQFAGTHIASIVILSICLSIAVLPFGVIGLVTCKHPEAKKHALLMVLIPLGLAVLGGFSAVF